MGFRSRAQRRGKVTGVLQRSALCAALSVACDPSGAWQARPTTPVVVTADARASDPAAASQTRPPQLQLDSISSRFKAVAISVQNSSAQPERVTRATFVANTFTSTAVLLRPASKPCLEPGERLQLLALEPGASLGLLRGAHLELSVLPSLGPGVTCATAEFALPSTAAAPLRLTLSDPESGPRYANAQYWGLEAQAKITFALAERPAAWILMIGAGLWRRLGPLELGAQVALGGAPAGSDSGNHSFVTESGLGVRGRVRVSTRLVTGAEATYRIGTGAESAVWHGPAAALFLGWAPLRFAGFYPADEDTLQGAKIVGELDMPTSSSDRKTFLLGVALFQRSWLF
ncbi:MAG TPA: hypothetical protein VER96_05855 [Polyangiaceae bacterium]|nr:hypothetical protein [Polyangiaceae bacterium]